MTALTNESKAKGAKGVKLAFQTLNIAKEVDDVLVSVIASGRYSACRLYVLKVSSKGSSDEYTRQKQQRMMLPITVAYLLLTSATCVLNRVKL